MIIKSALAWAPMVIIGILNGAVREFGYGRLWSLVLVAVAIAPYVVYRIRS